MSPSNLPDIVETVGYLKFKGQKIGKINKGIDLRGALHPSFHPSPQGFGRRPVSGRINTERSV